MRIGIGSMIITISHFKALAGKNAGADGMIPPRPVGAQRTRIAVFIVVQ